MAEVNDPSSSLEHPVTPCRPTLLAAEEWAAVVKRRLDDLTRLVSDWVWEIDRDHRLTYASDRVLEVLGYHPYELVGRRFSDLGSFVSDTDWPPRSGWQSPFRDLLFEAKDRDGRGHTFLVSGLPIFNRESGAFEGARGTADDITVNGAPVAIVEHKNPKDADAIERGVTQLRRYEIETPELMGSAQLFNVTHLLDYWYGVTWNLSRRFMARWKERPEDSYRFAVQSFFEPAVFLRTLRDWILFYVEDGETRKSVLRQHQRRAVDLIVERCAEPAKRRGLVWHTQGSGKTFTLLTAARMILERKDEFHTPTVVVVVDRTELEGQLAGWVERLLGEMQQQDIAVWRASSRAGLRELLATDRRGLIVSMIHKFEGIEKNASLRGNIYVFIDEAHRSVAKGAGYVPHGRAAQLNHRRIHRNAYRANGARRGNLQDIRCR